MSTRGSNHIPREDDPLLSAKSGTTFSHTHAPRRLPQKNKPKNKTGALDRADTTIDKDAKQRSGEMLVGKRARRPIAKASDQCRQHHFYARLEVVRSFLSTFPGRSFGEISTTNVGIVRCSEIGWIRFKVSKSKVDMKLGVGRYEVSRLNRT